MAWNILTQFDPDKKKQQFYDKKIGYCAVALSSLLRYKQLSLCQKKPLVSFALIRLERMNCRDEDTETTNEKQSDKGKMLSLPGQESFQS